MDLLNDPAFPNILNYNYYHFIRARGEIILSRYENEIEEVELEDRIQWIEVLDMTDEQFCQRMECPLDE